MKFCGSTLALFLIVQGTALATNAIILENKSGRPALVKMVGPAPVMVLVAKDGRQTANVPHGRYQLKVRYGPAGRYHYVRGGEVEVADLPSSSPDPVIRVDELASPRDDALRITQQAFDSNEPIGSRVPAVSPSRIEPPSEPKAKTAPEGEQVGLFHANRTLYGQYLVTVENAQAGESEEMDAMYAEMDKRIDSLEKSIDRARSASASARKRYGDVRRRDREVNMTIGGVPVSSRHVSGSTRHTAYSKRDVNEAEKNYRDKSNDVRDQQAELRDLESRRRRAAIEKAKLRKKYDGLKEGLRSAYADNVRRIRTGRIRHDGQLELAFRACTRGVVREEAERK